MLDVKIWLQSTGLPVEFVAFEKPPQLPYVVILEDQSVFGADECNLIVTRSLTVELYSRTSISSAENDLELLFNQKSVEYSKSTLWLPNERCYMVVYNFEITERK